MEVGVGEPVLDLEPTGQGLVLAFLCPPVEGVAAVPGEGLGVHLVKVLGKHPDEGLDVHLFVDPGKLLGEGLGELIGGGVLGGLHGEVLGLRSTGQGLVLSFLCLSVEGVAAVCLGLVLGAMVVAVEGVADLGEVLALGLPLLTLQPLLHLVDHLVGTDGQGLVPVVRLAPAILVPVIALVHHSLVALVWPLRLLPLLHLPLVLRVAGVVLVLVLAQPLQPLRPLLHLVDHLVGAPSQGLVPVALLVPVVRLAPTVLVSVAALVHHGLLVRVMFLSPSLFLSSALLLPSLFLSPPSSIMASLPSSGDPALFSSSSIFFSTWRLLFCSMTPLHRRTNWGFCPI